MDMIPDHLAEFIGEAGKPAHRDAHREVLPFHMAGRNGIGVFIKSGYQRSEWCGIEFGVAGRSSTHAIVTGSCWCTLMTARLMELPARMDMPTRGNTILRLWWA